MPVRQRERIRYADIFCTEVAHNFIADHQNKLVYRVIPNLFLNVRNLLNKDPAVVASSGSFGDTTSPYNAGLYDVMGRVYSAGVRIEF